MYKIFTRTWWKDNKNYPNGLEPCIGRSTTIARVQTEEDARLYCKEYNKTHKPGRLSRKAEYTRV